MTSNFNKLILKKISEVASMGTIVDLSHASFTEYDVETIKTLWMSIPKHVKSIQLDYCFLTFLSFEKFQALVANIPEHIEFLSLSYNFFYHNKDMMQRLACIPRHIKELVLTGNYILNLPYSKPRDLLSELMQVLSPELIVLGLKENGFNKLSEEDLQFFLASLPLGLQDLKIENLIYKSLQKRQTELLEEIQHDALEHRENLLTDGVYYINRGEWMPEAHLLGLIDYFVTLESPEAKLLLAFLFSTLWQMHVDDDEIAQQLELTAIQYFFQAASKPSLLNIVQYQLWHRWVTTSFDLVKQKLDNIRMEPPHEFVSHFGLFAEGMPEEVDMRNKKPTLEQYIHQ